MNKVLIADDDTELTDMLAEYLGHEGFESDVANDGKAASNMAMSNPYDIIILDVMMPHQNGFDVLRDLRKHTQVPVIMLTARGEDVDSIVGLEIGADDYLTKPCNPRVLVAHMRAILRRADSTSLPAKDNILIEGLDLQLGSRTVRYHNKPLTMTTTEFSILEILMRNAGSIVSKQQLSEHALGRDLSPYDRSLDMHISNLRKKLAYDTDSEELIKTIRGVGYQFVLPHHE